MHILDAPVDIARHSVLLFKLGGVAVDNQAAHTEVDPILVFGLLFRCGRARCCFSIGDGFAIAGCGFSVHGRFAIARSRITVGRCSSEERRIT